MYNIERRGTQRGYIPSETYGGRQPEKRISERYRGASREIEKEQVHDNGSLDGCSAYAPVGFLKYHNDDDDNVDVGFVNLRRRTLYSPAPVQELLFSSDVRFFPCVSCCVYTAECGDR